MHKTHGKIFHTTRMAPKRVSELLAGGSLYWVIKGKIRVRQRLSDIEAFTDGQCIGRCRLHLDAALVATSPHARRPFQGWRYLKADDAPLDILSSGMDDNMPDAMREELTELGLI